MNSAKYRRYGIYNTLLLRAIQAQFRRLYMRFFFILITAFFTVTIALSDTVRSQTIAELEIPLHSLNSVEKRLIDLEVRTLQAHETNKEIYTLTNEKLQLKIENAESKLEALTKNLQVEMAFTSEKASQAIARAENQLNHTQVYFDRFTTSLTICAILIAFVTVAVTISGFQIKGYFEKFKQDVSEARNNLEKNKLELDATARESENLKVALIKGQRDMSALEKDIDTLILKTNERYDDKYKELVEIIKKSQEEFSHLEKLRKSLFRTDLDSDRGNLAKLSVEKDKAAEKILQGDDAYAALYALALKKIGEEKWLFARDILNDCIKLKPTDVQTLIYMSYNNCMLSREQKIANAKIELLEEAIIFVTQAASINNANSLAWSNWAYALSLLADIEKHSERKMILLNEAEEKCQHALRLDNRNIWAWNSWSYILQDKSVIINNNELKIALLKDAIEKSKSAVALDGENYNAICGLARAFGKAANIERDLFKRTALFKEANTNFNTATKLAPRRAIYWWRWGKMLKAWSSHSDISVEDKTFLETETKDKFLKAKELGYEDDRLL